MERPATPPNTVDQRVSTAMAVCEQLATALKDGPTDLVAVELNRAHLVITRLLRELGVTDEMPDC